MEEKEKEKETSPITIRDLRKAFGPQTVLNGIDLKVAKRETLAVLCEAARAKACF